MRKFLLIAIVLLFASAAIADDLFPPWWRGMERTFTAHWDDWAGFHDYDGTTDQSVPDASNRGDLMTDPDFNKAVAPMAVLLGGNDFLASYYERGSVVEVVGDDQLTLTVPNFAGGTEKTMRLQITWLEDPDCPYSPAFDVTAYDQAYMPLDGWTDEFTLGQLAGLHYEPIGTTGLVWATMAVDIHFDENPYWESVGIKFRDGGMEVGGFIDQIVIDTICGPVPEPATIILLGAGAVVAVRRRKTT